MSYCIRLNGHQEDNYILVFRVCKGISFARYLYSVIESTPSPWDSGSHIDSPSNSFACLDALMY